MNWRIVKGSGSSLWLERVSPGPGESLYFANEADAQGALEVLAAQFGWQLTVEVPPMKPKGPR